MYSNASRNWRYRILDIQNAITKIQTYTEGLTFEEFQHHPTQVDAVLYNFTIIGEAARAIPQELQNRYPEIPWRDMSDLRNRVVHEYFRVSYEIVWDTIQHDLSQLFPQLQRLLEVESM